MNEEQPSTLTRLTTESHNPASANIDALSALEIVRLMNEQDASIASAVAREAETIAQSIELIAERFRTGGRLIYTGAGTSGRLGVLDASECPPTFSTPPEMVVGLIAGGPAALTRAIEGAEDHPETGAADVEAIGVGDKDVVVGIATSGRTPYVVGALEAARRAGAATIGFSCNEQCELRPRCDLMITPIVGPEIISGSTRMKSGTATKMVLNMLTTGAMIRIGKTYGNLMVDLKATNQKLTHRSRRIVAELADVDVDAAATQLDRCDGEVKTAVVSLLCGVAPQQARERLNDAGRAASCGTRTRPVGATLMGDKRTLVLGVDGGGSKTAARLALVDDQHKVDVLGRGQSGPSNWRSLAAKAARSNLDLAIEQAFRDADLERQPVTVATLAVAGVDPSGGTRGAAPMVSAAGNRPADHHHQRRDPVALRCVGRRRRRRADRGNRIVGSRPKPRRCDRARGRLGTSDRRRRKRVPDRAGRAAGGCAGRGRTRGGDGIASTI